LEWVQKIDLGHGKFSFEDHEYQKAIFEENARRQCFKKGAQMGFTEVIVLKTIYGMIHGNYPQGVGIFFPSESEVQDFSRARFGTIIRDNSQVAEHVTGTDAMGIKQIGKRSTLYLRGMRPTGKIENIKKTSSQLKSIPLDKVILEECDDFIDWAMVDLALQRLGHSKLQEEVYVSTPTIPNFGIDALYNESDQRVWEIRCEHCGEYTCLEKEFPNCLLENSSGEIFRACKKCKREIHPRNGRWTPLYPDRSKDLVAWHISQLNSAFVSPKKILDEFQNPPRGNLTEFYNSRLGLSYISAENRLTPNDVYLCCGQDVMLTWDRGPCAMGVDVGSQLHVVVAYKPKDKILQACYLVRVSSFNDVHDIAKKFNVQCACIDALPETRKVREFQQAESYPVWLCYYTDSQYDQVWDESNRIIKANRNELLDISHDLVQKPGELVIPRRNEELEQFALEMSNEVKVLEEGSDGSRTYKYRTTGPSHYRHALGYCWLASERVPVSPDSSYEKPVQKYAISEWDEFAI